MKFKRVSLVMFVFLFSLFLGCASTEQRVQDLKAQHPDWDAATIEKIANRQVEKGMTQEMVIAAYGRKGEVKSGSAMDEESWTYYREVQYGDTARWVPGKVVYFKGGKVVSVSDAGYAGKR